MRKTVLLGSPVGRRLRIPASAREEIVELSEQIETATLSRDELDVPQEVSVSLFTDASSAALAAVYRDGRTFRVTAWDAPRCAEIFAREALAALMGTATIERPRRVIGLAIDNANYAQAVRKGHSSNAEVNQVLRAQYALGWQKGFTLATTWVPTNRQLADNPSRGLPLPEHPEAEFDRAPPARPLPFWRPPAAADARSLMASCHDRFKTTRIVQQDCTSAGPQL